MLVDGRWYPGWLDPDNWRKEQDGWICLVRWQSAPAENRRDTFDRENIQGPTAGLPPGSVRRLVGGGRVHDGLHLEGEAQQLLSKPFNVHR